MGSEDEGLKFEVNEEDLEYELNPFRSFRKQTKDDAIYGIWAAKRDNEDQRKSAKSHYKAFGMTFVSGGVTVPNEEKNEEESQEDEDSDAITDSEGEEDDFRSGMQSASGGPPVKKRVTMQESNGSLPRTAAERNAVRSSAAYRPSHNFGSWEKHTKGVGYKLLDKMGYIPGKGLGKSNQGIVNPVTAKKREAKAGIGAMGSERNEEDAFIDASISGAANPEEARRQLAQAKQQAQRQWRKTGGKKKAQYKFTTLEDLRKQASTTKQFDFSGLGNVKVIDKTGPETKYLHGYDEMAQQYRRPAEDESQSDGEVDSPAAKRSGSGFQMPELTHNVGKIVNLVEQQIVKADQTIQRSEDRLAHLKFEEDRLSRQFDEEEADITRLSDLINRIQDIESRNKSKQLSLDELTERFWDLKQKFSQEFVLYELNNLSVALAFPKAKAAVDAWDVGRDPGGPVDSFTSWREMLNDDDQSRAMYAHLIWDYWMPKIRRLILDCDIRDADKLIRVLEEWRDIIPSNIFGNLSDQFIVPRLQQALDAWSPVSDTVPVHSWVHPWLPVLGKRLQPLYVTIRAKLAQCLVNWDPTDRSAKLIIQPWREVFTQGEMEAFLVKAICPKLKMALHLMPIDSSNSGLEVLKSVLCWHDLLSTYQLIQILLSHFFPKWTSALCLWLSNNPDPGEIAEWYRQWKALFPVHLLEYNEIKSSFSQVLEIMRRSANGVSVANYQFVPPKSSIAPPAVASANNGVSGGGGNPLRPSSDIYVPQSIARLQQHAAAGGAREERVVDTFRDLVERKALEQNLVFAPVPGLYHEGKQVYSLGCLKVFIEKGVVFVSRFSKWQPIALPNALMQASKS